jgi:ubiquinone/menaquinone biosynthesis C-methylase UbiE
MNASMNRIREEFDQIALLTEQHSGGRVGETYYDYLMQHVPPRPENALEIGCGSGAFTRLLASRARSVVALDLSAEMIRLAEAHSGGYQNIEYRLGDVMQIPLATAEFDCIVSIATLHHLPLKQALLKMKDALKADGTLVIHDLIADDGILDRGMSALAYPVSAVRRFWETGQMRAPREVREAWAEHGKNEVYLTVSEVRDMCRQYLPEAQVKRHLLWRYTVVWCKRSAA